MCHAIRQARRRRGQRDAGLWGGHPRHRQHRRRRDARGQCRRRRPAAVPAVSVCIAKTEVDSVGSTPLLASLCSYAEVLRSLWHAWPAGAMHKHSLAQTMLHAQAGCRAQYATGSQQCYRQDASGAAVVCTCAEEALPVLLAGGCGCPLAGGAAPPAAPAPPVGLHLLGARLQHVLSVISGDNWSVYNVIAVKDSLDQAIPPTPLRAQGTRR